MNTKRIPQLILVSILTVMLGCSKTEDYVPLNPPTQQITVDELVREASLRNQEIPFKIVDDQGNDVTSVATFYVDGVTIEGSVFSSADVGEFEVYGVYMQDGVEITTNTESFKVIIPKQKIVVEDYTGAWCGFCPRVAAAIHDLELETEQIAVVAIHETAPSYADAMHFDQIQILKDAYAVDGLPAARINRSVDWPMPHDLSNVTAIAGIDTDMAISINSELTGNQLLVQVDVVSENGSQPGDKLVVYLLEDGIVHGQINYYNADPTSPFYNMGDIIQDFVHNDVLRNSLTDVLGNPIPSTSALIEYTTSFTLDIPVEYVVENLEIVAMVVDQNNTAKNAQFAHLSEKKPYE